jgi:hypothetical protein
MRVQPYEVQPYEVQQCSGSESYSAMGNDTTDEYFATYTLLTKPPGCVPDGFSWNTPGRR